MIKIFENEKILVTVYFIATKKKTMTLYSYDTKGIYYF